jgi:hypothetical protein
LTPYKFTPEDAIRYARGFGADLGGQLQTDDQRFLDPQATLALPMIAVALADGEFWHAKPDAGLHWKQMVHAEEAITVHQPLPQQGVLTVERCVVDIYDRGINKGALLKERQVLSDERGAALVTIDITTILRGDGKFGVNTESPPRAVAVRDHRPADAVVEMRTPGAEQTIFALASNLDVAKDLTGARPEQLMLRGMCGFGLAGRAVLHLVCGNDPQRLKRLFVRYAGPLLTDETAKVERWHTGAGSAAFRLTAIERFAPVLSQCQATYMP